MFLKNTDYTLEAGATRLFEAEKLAKEMAERERQAIEDEELNNPMKVWLFIILCSSLDNIRNKMFANTLSILLMTAWCKSKFTMLCKHVIVYCGWITVTNFYLRKLFY
jgi:hypothetical protein